MCCLLAFGSCASAGGRAASGSLAVLVRVDFPPVVVIGCMGGIVVVIVVVAEAVVVIVGVGAVGDAEQALVAVEQLASVDVVLVEDDVAGALWAADRQLAFLLLDLAAGFDAGGAVRALPEHQRGNADEDERARTGHDDRGTSMARGGGWSF